MGGLSDTGFGLGVALALAVAVAVVVVALLSDVPVMTDMRKPPSSNVRGGSCRDVMAGCNSRKFEDSTVSRGPREADMQW